MALICLLLRRVALVEPQELFCLVLGFGGVGCWQQPISGCVGGMDLPRLLRGVLGRPFPLFVA